MNTEKQSHDLIDFNFNINNTEYSHTPCTLLQATGSADIKNRSPVEARIKFFNFDTSYLKIVVDLDFGAQNAPKIEPKRLPKPFKNQLKIRVKLNVDFDRNLAQLGGQLGLNLGAQVEHFWRTFANLKGYPFRDPNMTPK